MPHWISAVAILALPSHNPHVHHEDGRRVPASSEPPTVEPVASHPSEMLECLRRHRYTPLVCQLQKHTEEHVASPPPPAQECGVGSVPNDVCFYGRGRCQYDATRGWYCQCGVPRQVARGVHRAAESFAMVPHCIDD